MKKKNTLKFEVMDFVKMSSARKTFKRVYDQRWNGKLFQIVNRDGLQRYPTYKIKYNAREPIDGIFIKRSYKRYYKVEKNFKSRKIKGRPKEVLVRWLHWPPKYDSWIPATDITDYYKYKFL